MIFFISRFFKVISLIKNDIKKIVFVSGICNDELLPPSGFYPLLHSSTQRLQIRDPQWYGTLKTPRSPFSI